MAAPTSQTNPLPPSPSEQGILKEDQKSLISLPWVQWFLSLAAKVNTINVNSVGWSKVPIDSGVTPGTYGDATHYPTFTVDIHGLITLASEVVSSGGGNATYVTNQTGNYSVLTTDIPASSSYKGLIGIAASSPVVLTLSADASLTLPVGSECGLFQGGTGAVSFAGGSGATLLGPTITGLGQYAKGKAIKIAANTWLISGNLAFVASGSDPYFSYVVALLHLDGTSGSTTFTDIISKVWTRFGSTTAISTVQYQFGGASMLVGTTIGAGTNNGINTPATSSFILGTGDFTYEWFEYITSISTYYTALSIGQTAAGGLLIQSGAGDGKYNLYVSGTSVCAEGSATTINTWLHHAVVKDSGVLRKYRNGVQTASVSDSTSLTTSTTPVVGATLTGTYAVDGYIDEVRLTKGYCRYPGGTTFTPPTAPFPNS